MFSQAPAAARVLPNHILIADKREVLSWARHYGVSENQLRRAINAVGDSRFRVEGWLKYQGLWIN